MMAIHCARRPDPSELSVGVAPVFAVKEGDFR